MPLGVTTPRPLTRSTRPLGVPGATRSFTGGPPRVGTSMVAPSAASTKVTGTLTRRLRPSRSKTGCLRTVTVSTMSPGSPPSGLGCPCPRSLIFCPSATPARDLDLDRPTLLRLQGDLIAVGGGDEVDRGRRDHVAPPGRPAVARGSRRSRCRTGHRRLSAPAEHAAEEVVEAGLLVGVAAVAGLPPPNMPPKTSSKPPCWPPPAAGR